MKEKFLLYNTLTRQKEIFKPIHSDVVGMYVCGPTVYADPHLGHARPAITFDILYRFLKYLGYKVRYVRNITDVGHLENDDEGEDKIVKKARLEQLEPMEIAQFYYNRYVEMMNKLNVLPPSVEPRATGHIIEQIELIKTILSAGYAYEINGSVYFDVRKYSEKFNYGKLSGRKLDELIANTRQLEGQAEKRFTADFALWKKAPVEHIMKWPSPWGLGFPGWHLECSAMGLKYLGEQFDIHGGGMDLLFPHHECEIAQNVAALGHESVRYWIHNNMITINGQKMSKSLNNFITLEQLFNGSHPLLEQPYSPMTIRFFILQAHYRSTIDFSNHALQSSQKALRKLIEAKIYLDLIARNALNVDTGSKNKTQIFVKSAFEALLDDLNTPVAIVQLFEASKLIFQAFENKINLSFDEINDLNILFNVVFNQILGIDPEFERLSMDDKFINQLVDSLLEIRSHLKIKKEYELADLIRQRLDNLGISVKDTKDGYIWERRK